MDFDKSKVYTALNADELKVGSKVAFADNLSDLKMYVRDEEFDTLRDVRDESRKERFVRLGGTSFSLCYLVSEPKPEQLDWIVYLHRRYSGNPYLTCCRSDRWEIVQKDCGAKTKLFVGTEKECDDWYSPRRQFSELIAAWEDGKTIQFLAKVGNKDWEDLENPAWEPKFEYRIKPEGLKWTDLKVGDILHKTDNDTDVEAMVIAIDKKPATICHVMIANGWTTDKCLADSWEKVK